MVTLTERLYNQKIPCGTTAVIGADIGGTNSNFGIFDKISSHPLLLFSLHAKSQEVRDFPLLVRDVLRYAKEKYNLTIDHALFACAGVVSSAHDSSKPTNLNIVIDAHAIVQATGLKCVYIVNDFVVIGYGIELLDPASLVSINKGTLWSKGNKAIVGAGTGLGKCNMFYNTYAERYVPIPSEGGHADAVLERPIEYEFAKFIQQTEEFSCPVSWEDVLSGNGIQRMYRFFHTRANANEHTKQEKVPYPDEIFKSRLHDKHSGDTFNLYTLFYARCLKNFALDALALGGLYVAGGIAAHNVPLFQTSLFMKEFLQCGKLAYLLKNIPVYVIADYNVSLYGAAYYLYLEDVCQV